jgi:hypothetical protein
MRTFHTCDLAQSRLHPMFIGLRHVRYSTDSEKTLRRIGEGTQAPPFFEL